MVEVRPARYEVFCLRLLLGFLIALEVICGFACDRNPMYQNEARALESIRLLQKAEAQYHVVHRRYADLAALGPSGAGLVPKELADGSAAGYEIHVDPSATGYVLTAQHGREGTAPYRSFYSDETGVIRYSLGPNSATTSSARIDGRE